jgi:Flp pilus assembly protein TadD
MVLHSWALPGTVTPNTVTANDKRGRIMTAATETKVVDFIYELYGKAHDAWDAGHLDTAVDTFRRLARMGETDAMNCLATLLDDHLQPRKPQEAIYWYMRCVRAEDNLAAWNLAMHYVPRGNKRWYDFWMAKAEKMGHEKAAIEMDKIRHDCHYMTLLPMLDPDEEREDNF